MQGHAIFSGSVCVPLLVFASPLSAATTSAAIDVSLVVLPGCSVSATPLTFAARTGAPAEAQAAIDVTCSGDTGVAVSLDAGRYPADGHRRLASDTGTHVSYAIYSDAARTRQWQDTAVAGRAAPGSALRLVAYGRIEGRDTAVPVGIYRDSVTVTVEF
jgi:spore coat protein U-like protein